MWLTPLLLMCGFADTPFVQEYRTEVPWPDAPKAGEVRAMAVASDGSVWIASKAGVFRHSGGHWSLIQEGSAYAIVARDSEIWAGAWNGLYRISSQRANRIPSVPGPVVALWADARGIVAASQTAIHEWDGSKWSSQPWNGSRAVRSIARERGGGLWIATGMGAWYLRPGRPPAEFHSEPELLSGELRAVTLAPDGSVWLGGTGGVDVYRAARRAEHYNTANGMPNPDVHALAAEPGGTVWIGTSVGALRRKGPAWSLLHSRRWLPSDEVRAIAPGADGTVWVATTGGLSAIHRRTMTLAAKAGHYHGITMARHVRAPWLVEQCDLAAPGDTAHFKPRDDDNDGQYTGMYLAMESFRYAVTKDPAARENARKAFHALKFLQEVTATSGFFARTVVPSDWEKVHDPNETFTPEEKVDRTVANPRSKPVEDRWRRSRDGKWLWKGDTSSDETSGHFHGYFIYYKLAADEAERQVIREHVRRVMDYIIEGGYTFRDIDGKPTLWGNWSPEKLNHEAGWRAERWTNGLEILAYLQAAYYITGEAKYRRHYLELIEREGYGKLARRPLATEPSERTHFDNELVALVLPIAMSETDPRLRAIYQEALRFWLPHIKGQYSPFFSFTWAALAGKQAWDEVDLARCISVLREEPLDLVQWTVDNRQREDVRLIRSPHIEELQLDRILPPGERATMRWDSNPWSAVRGEGGMSESSGVFWLLPYWMGRYYGFIQPEAGLPMPPKSASRKWGSPPPA